jgi:allantoinase
VTAPAAGQDAAPADLLVRAARAVIDGAVRPAGILVRDGVVAGVLPADTPSPARVTWTLRDDEVLLPGLVDTHVHVNEPGRTDWEGFASATRAAAAGGVTTLVDMPLNSIPPTVDVPALRAKQAAATGRCHVDVAFWAGAVPGHTGDLAALVGQGACGAKGFLADSGVPEFPPLDEPGLRAALAALAPTGAPLLVHAEDAAVLAAAPPASGTSYRRYLASRPAEAEVRGVAAVLRAARQVGGRVHIVHLSAGDALPLVAAARAQGVEVSVETCPHYLVLAAEELADGDPRVKCAPPVREAANRERLWAGLADGTIDMVVSDHSPAPPALKALDTGDLATAWGGIASLQLGLPLVWTAARARGQSLADVASWMAARPARLAGLGGKGRLAVGADADMVAFAPEQTWTVHADQLAHRHPVTPYDGWTVTGAVRRTWLRGRVVAGDGNDRVDVPSGRLLRREPAGAAR